MIKITGFAYRFVPPHHKNPLCSNRVTSYSHYKVQKRIFPSSSRKAGLRGNLVNNFCVTVNASFRPPTC